MELSTVKAGDNRLPVLFFIHGWPDSADLWSGEMQHFSTRFHCIAVTLPGFGKDAAPKWGYDFPAVTDALAQTIRAHAPHQAVTVVGHDWGAYLAYLLEQKHPELVSRIVALDIGGHFEPRSVLHACFFVGYQTWLAAAFLIGHTVRPLGDVLTRAFCHLMKTPRRDARASMNYFYFYIWRGLLNKKYASSLLRRYRPTRPLLFVYGGAKKYPFHSAKWEKTVAATPESRVVRIDSANHWVNLTAPQELHRHMDQWLAETEKNTG